MKPAPDSTPHRPTINGQTTALSRNSLPATRHHLNTSTYHATSNRLSGTMSAFFPTPNLLLARMRSLTTLILKGVSVEISNVALFRLFVTCPEQVLIFKIEYLVKANEPYTGRSNRHHVEQGQTDNLRPPYLYSPTNLPNHICLFQNCVCLEGLDDMIWPLTTPTQIRVLALPDILGSEQSRPAIIPFLRHRCPELQSLKLRNLGTTSLNSLRDLLCCEAFPDLRHLELGGIRKNQATIYQNMFPIYKILLRETIGHLESLTISEDSDLVDDVPQFVSMVLESHARTLNTVRWLGPAGIGPPDQRLDLEWFLYRCPNQERMETTSDNRYCTLGQGAVGTVTILDHDPTSPTSSPPPKTPPILSKIGLSSWACTKTLTYLDISSRPSATIKDEHQYRLEIESLYKKLGHLTALVKLHIGCECHCRGPQLQNCQHSVCPQNRPTPTPTVHAPIRTPPGDPHQQTPTATTTTTIFDMSLATGLAHMAGLKNFEILNTSRIQGHTILILELEWMKKHWSKRLRILQAAMRYEIGEWLNFNWSELDARWCNSMYERWKDDWKVYRPIEKK